VADPSLVQKGATDEQFGNVGPSLAGSTAGNFLVATYVWISANATPTLPAGWTSRGSITQVCFANASFFMGITEVYKANIAGGPVSAATLDFTGSTTVAQGWIEEWHDVVTVSPFDSGGSNTASNANSNSPAVTGAGNTAQASNLIRATTGVDGLNASTNVVISHPPSGGAAFTDAYNWQDATAKACGDSGYKSVNGIATYSASWTKSVAGEFVAMLSVYKGVGGAGGGGSDQMILLLAA